MHAFLITGGSPLERTGKEQTLCKDWKAGTFDIFRLDVPADKGSVGITEIRILTHNLSFSPRQSPVVVGIIEQAERLTPEAQNALLKTLEEPPPKARLILKTDHASLLLPTVVSRCHVIHLTAEKHIDSQDLEKILDILRAGIGKRPGEISQFVDQYFSKKEQGVWFFTTLLTLLHADLANEHPEKRLPPVVSRDAHQLSYIIRAVLKAQSQLAANVHFTSVLDAFFRQFRFTNLNF